MNGVPTTIGIGNGGNNRIGGNDTRRTKSTTENRSRRVSIQCRKGSPSRRSSRIYLNFIPAWQFRHIGVFALCPL